MHLRVFDHLHLLLAVRKYIIQTWFWVLEVSTSDFYSKHITHSSASFSDLIQSFEGIYLKLLLQALLQVGLRSIQDQVRWALPEDLCFHTWLRNAASPRYLQRKTVLVWFHGHHTPRANTCTSWQGSILALRVLIHWYDAKHNTTSNGTRSSLITIMPILKAWGPSCPCNSMPYSIEYVPGNSLQYPCCTASSNGMCTCPYTILPGLCPYLCTILPVALNYMGCCLPNSKCHTRSSWPQSRRWTPIDNFFHFVFIMPSAWISEIGWDIGEWSQICCLLLIHRLFHNQVA